MIAAILASPATTDAQGMQHAPQTRAAAAPAPASATPPAERDALIRQALSAAPPTLREHARVMDLQGNVLRDGASEYTCLPAPPGLAGPMCLDRVFMEWFQAFANRRPPNVTRVGVAYMMAGDSADGGASNINPFDAQPNAGNDWMVEGPHVMMIVPDAAHLESIPAAHNGGGAYVMWRGSPYAHIMMPVGERPRQRSVAAR